MRGEWKVNERELQKLLKADTVKLCLYTHIYVCVYTIINDVEKIKDTFFQV